MEWPIYNGSVENFENARILFLFNFLRIDYFQMWGFCKSDLQTFAAEKQSRSMSPLIGFHERKTTISSSMFKGYRCESDISNKDLCKHKFEEHCAISLNKMFQGYYVAALEHGDNSANIRNIYILL